jgi:2-dehydropantoate 2-reductase
VRITVIGAGALGLTFASLLSRAGHEVTVIARGASLAVLRADGIRLSGAFGDVEARPTVLEHLTEQPELTLLCTKAQDARAALSAEAGVVDGSPVIVVQNGLDGIELARGLLPRSDCYGALSLIAANYDAPGSVRITTAAPTYLGRGAGPADEASRHWAKILSSAVPVVAIPNFRGAQWSKLVVNMLNALPAITGLTVQAVVADSQLRRVLTLSMRETVRVGLLRGVHFGSLQGITDRRLHWFARLPIRLGQVLPLRMRARMGSVPNLGSTLQSLVRGQRTEIDFLNGAVVREAYLAGTPAPVNALLTVLVHEVEASGEHLPVSVVLERMPR